MTEIGARKQRKAPIVGADADRLTVEISSDEGEGVDSTTDETVTIDPDEEEEFLIFPFPYKPPGWGLGGQKSAASGAN